MLFGNTPPPPLVLIAGSARDAATALLREAGCRVREAGSAAAALRLAGPGAECPALVLLGDAFGELTDLGSLELLSRLQDEPATRDIPVLYAGGGDGELALALGAVDCLGLPLRPLLLLSRVRAELKLQHLRSLAQAAGIAA